MKKIKKITSLLLAVVMCIALASCNMTQTTEVKSDGTASIAQKITASENELKQIELIEENSPDDSGMMFSLVSGTTIQSAADFKKQSDKQGLTETINGVKYYSNIEKKNYKNLNDLNNDMFAANVGKVTTTDFWGYAVSDPESDEMAKQQLQMIEDLGFKLDISITLKLPYKIVKTNCKKVDDNTIEYSNDDKLVYAISDKSTASWTKSTDLTKAVKDMAKKQCAPKKVTGLKVAYKSSKSLKINWNPLDGMYITGYKVEKKIGKAGWKVVKTVKAEDYSSYDDNMKLFYTDKKISANKKYSYRVRAYCKTTDFTSYGSYSSAKSITVADLKSKPVLKVKALKKKATLKLKKNTKYLTGYEIKYAKNSKFKSAKIVKVKKFPQTLKLTSGKKYYFKVRKYCKAEKGNVYSGWSKTVSAKIK